MSLKKCLKLANDKFGMCDGYKLMLELDRVYYHKHAIEYHKRLHTNKLHEYTSRQYEVEYRLIRRMTHKLGDTK